MGGELKKRKFLYAKPVALREAAAEELELRRRLRVALRGPVIRWLSHLFTQNYEGAIFHGAEIPPRRLQATPPPDFTNQAALTYNNFRFLRAPQ